MNTKEQARVALNGLIKKYEGLKANKEFSSNESQVSESLIKSFVKIVLGWDTSDFSEFKVESRVRGKRSDMLVCLNGVTQFIIEAKSLVQDISGHNEFIKQTINYANSKDKAFAILTNFKHFVIIRCDIKVDNSLKAVVKTLNVENLSDADFDLLYNFSKEIWVEKCQENPLFKLHGDYKKRTKVDTYKFIYSNAIRSMDFYKAYAQKIPIPKRNAKLEVEITNLADKILSLNKKLQEIGDKNTLEKQKIEQEIKKTDNEIDELVYQLYGITEQEKKIIEESLK